MVNSLYRFSDVEAQNPTPTTIDDAIKSVLKADGDACYQELEQYILPPGVSGSKFFDQAYAVRALLEHDKLNGGEIASIMVATPALKHRVLWDHLQKVLRKAGFKMKHGRLAGLLENRANPDNENGDDGQPDID